MTQHEPAFGKDNVKLIIKEIGLRNLSAQLGYFILQCGSWFTFKCDVLDNIFIPIGDA